MSLTLREIGAYAFSSATLTKFHFGPGIENIKTGNFNNSAITKNFNKTTVYIPGVGGDHKHFSNNIKRTNPRTKGPSASKFSESEFEYNEQTLYNYAGYRINSSYIEVEVSKENYDEMLKNNYSDPNFINSNLRVVTDRMESKSTY